MSSSNENAAPIDPYTYLGLTKNQDGSITRKTNLIPISPPLSDPNQPVISKDVEINKTNNTFTRLYLPNPVPTEKLPLIVYFHGGGFVVGSPSTTMFQNFIFGISANLPAVVVSVGYRLAPEHRLPAAYEDCMEALHWVKTTNEEWLTTHADVSNCFLMGTSAGGNIAWRVGLRAAMHVRDFAPVRIRGLVLHHAFFGGVKRCASEVRLMNNPFLPVNATDVMWELALPVGVDRDHEWCNPTVGIELEKVKELTWKVMVTGCEGDPLVDRQMELVKVLEEKSVIVVGEFSEGGSHGCELWEEDKAEIFYGVLKKFVLGL